MNSTLQSSVEAGEEASASFPKAAIPRFAIEKQFVVYNDTTKRFLYGLHFAREYEFDPSGLHVTGEYGVDPFPCRSAWAALRFSESTAHHLASLLTDETDHDWVVVHVSELEAVA